MSYKMGAEAVKYACTCGLLKSLPYLYFCRHCSQLRCGFCVCPEVDSIFCGKCCETIPSAEAKVKKNKCANCFVCPSCQQELSTRIASKGPVNTEDAKSSMSSVKKTYYLSCYYCRWNSRDVGIPDQASATGGWPQRENVHSNHLQQIIDTYKQVMVSQKQKKEVDKKKQLGKQMGFVSYTDRTGVTASALRKRIGLSDIPHAMLKKPKMPEPAIARSEVEELPDEIFNTPVSLMNITTIEQRLLQPESQPTTVDKLFPVQKQLSVKKSLRCRQCERNISKPEYNPTSIKFKIQLFAYVYIPQITIVSVGQLLPGKPCDLIIKFLNQTTHQTTITILDLDLAEQEAYVNEQKIIDIAERFEQHLSLETTKASLTSPQPSSLLSHTPRQPSITLKARKIEETVNCEVAIPESPFILPPRDDAAEYDDSADIHNVEDDPNLVVWRKSNKALVKLQVTPGVDLKENDEVMCGFTMEHIFTNIIAATFENKQQPPKMNHRVRVFFNLGKVANV
ncbi:dynactin subunit 4 [Euwallacea fornicatus]|uniref:dynactin subunit 4 n=1 Tax=Euwallacea fornicatus TaxID=995702 RepID=UPI00338DDCCE